MNLFKNKWQQCWNGRNPNLKHYNENMSLFISIVSLTSTTFCCGHHKQEAKIFQEKKNSKVDMHFNQRWDLCKLFSHCKPNCKKYFVDLEQGFCKDFVECLMRDGEPKVASKYIYFYL